MTRQAHDSAETERLLQELREGDTSARERLFSRHRDYLRRMIGLRADPRLRARVDPSDVVQEAQMEAARRLGHYLDNPALPFRLWLRQIAYDRLAMLHRRHVLAGRRSVERDVPLPARSSLLLAQQLLAAAPSPHEQLVRHELGRRLKEALSQLADIDREIILLRNFEGLSNQEAAQVLDVEPVAASKRYGRALLRLRQILIRDDTGE
jgi:RNA polymerase sigma-70 factor (ECF subfamily)